MQHNIEDIARQFDFAGSFTDAQPYGSGHINDTYCAAFALDGGGARRYVLQRVNHEVFKNPPELMENVERITRHIRAKLEAEGAADINRRVLTVVPTGAGALHYRDEAGNYWRAYDLVERTRSYDTIDTPEKARTAARMFGRFQKQLVDLPGAPLHDTIPGFHDTPNRYRVFLEILEANRAGRADEARAEIDFIVENAWIADVLADLAARGEVPVRATHNDTKINNVLFDVETDEALCVIDLDTAMPGLSLFDFGDMVRTATCPAEEDERDLSKIAVQMPLFEGLLRGFLEETREFLTPAERHHLPFAGKLITFEQAIRFLGDHLAGDVYYKIHRAGQNLDRARTQIALVRSIVKNEKEMDALVARI